MTSSPHRIIQNTIFQSKIPIECRHVSHRFDVENVYRHHKLLSPNSIRAHKCHPLNPLTTTTHRLGMVCGCAGCAAGAAWCMMPDLSIEQHRFDTHHRHIPTLSAGFILGYIITYAHLIHIPSTSTSVWRLFVN